MIATVPWLFLVKFWVNFLTHSDISNPNDGVKILWIIGVVIFWLAIKFYKYLTKGKYNIEITKIIPEPLIYFFWLYIIFLPIIIPSESFAIRIFIPLLPFFSIVFSRLVFKILKNKSNLKYLTTIVIFILSYIFIFTMLRQYTHYGKTNWIKNVFEYAQSTNFDQKNDIILSTWQDLSLAFYSDYEIYRTETLRADFVNNYPNRILFILPYKHLEELCPEENKKFVRDHNFWMHSRDYSKFIPRLEKCSQKTLGAEVLMFDCPALEKISN